VLGVNGFELRDAVQWTSRWHVVPLLLPMGFRQTSHGQSPLRPKPRIQHQQPPLRRNPIPWWNVCRLAFKNSPSTTLGPCQCDRQRKQQNGPTVDQGDDTRETLSHICSGKLFVAATSSGK